MAYPKVSVLCVTNRPGALAILRAGLEKQTYKNFNLVVVDGMCDRDPGSELSGSGINWQWFAEPEPKNKQITSVPFNLGQAYNYGITNCSGEYIFCLQDYIWIPANAIEKFVDRITLDADKKTVVIGVGHKAKYPESIEGMTPEMIAEKPTGISEIDDRLVDSNRDVQWVDSSKFELNYAMAPKQMFYDAGGLEESFDNTFYGADNTALGLKAEIMGYKFLIDKSNECIGYNQSLFPRPCDWEQRHNNKGNYNVWARTATTGSWTNYLSK